MAITGSATGQDPADPQRARARVLYEEALRKMDAHKPAEACPLLEEVLTRLPDLVGAKITLAECYVQTGRLASASRLFVAVEEEAARTGQEVRRRKAAEKVKALEPRLARLRVVVDDALRGAEGLVIKRDGEKLAPSQWGVAVPVDLGLHEIEALLPGKPPWKTTVNVSKDGALIDLPIAPSPEKTSAQGAPRADVRGAAAPQVSYPSESRWSTPKVASVVGMGLGAVGLAVGIGYGIKAINAKSESDAGHCDALNVCDSEGLALRATSISSGNVSTGMFVAGSALLAGSTLLFVFSTSKTQEGGAKVAIGPRGIVLRGTW